MKKRISIYLRVILAVIICCLILRIAKKTGVLGVSINPISSESQISSPSGALKYFYEPKAFSQGQKLPDYIPFNATYTINSDSLNERYEYSRKKSNDVFRIITLGDSFTYGMYVNTKDNWSEILEDFLNQNLKCKNISQFEVINLGVYGYDNDYSVERYKKRGVKYDPDLILWFQVVPTRMNELTIPVTKKFYAEASKSGELQKQIDKGKYYESGIKARAKIINDFGEDRLLDYQKKAILSLRNYYSGPLIMMVQPSLKVQEKEMIKNVTNEIDTWKYFDGLEEYVNEKGFFAGDGHPNQKGHRLIAESMYKYLVDSGIISCDSLKQ